MCLKQQNAYVIKVSILKRELLLTVFYCVSASVTLPLWNYMPQAAISLPDTPVPTPSPSIPTNTLRYKNPCSPTQLPTTDKLILSEKMIGGAQLTRHLHQETSGKRAANSVSSGKKRFEPVRRGVGDICKDGGPQFCTAPRVLWWSKRATGDSKGSKRSYGPVDFDLFDTEIVGSNLA
jgi:hypothetical protein